MYQASCYHIQLWCMHTISALLVPSKQLEESTAEAGLRLNMPWNKVQVCSTQPISISSYIPAPIMSGHWYIEWNTHSLRGRNCHMYSVAFIVPQRSVADRTVTKEGWQEQQWVRYTGKGQFHYSMGRLQCWCPTYNSMLSARIAWQPWS